MSRARRRYPLVAAILAALAAVVVFVRVTPEELPAWVARRVGGVDPLAVRGGVVAHYEVDGEPADRGVVIDNVWRRVGAWGVADAWAGWDRGDTIVVALPGVPEHRMDAYHGLLEVGGLLEFRMVVHGHEVSKRTFAEVEQDPEARRAGIEAQTDSWSHEAGDQPFIDYFLTGPSVAVLDRYLTARFARRPELRPPDGMDIAYERYPRRDPDTGEPSPIGQVQVRTYLVHRRVHLGNGDIRDAEVTYSPYDHRAEVLVTFTEDAGRRFGDLTHASIGHKLAIMLDGEISSAPVIQGAIYGGRSTINMGGGDPVKAEAEARGLAGVLRAGTIDVKLHEVGLEYRPPRASAGALLLAARGVFALGAGLLLLVALLIGRRLGAAALGPDLPGPRLPAARWPWLRLGVSTAVVLAVWKLAPRLKLPTLNRDEMQNLVTDRAHIPSVFHLGITSVLLAFALVELAALIVPPWRRLRHAGFAGRGALGPAVLIVAMILAGLQAWPVATFFEQAGVTSPDVPAVGWVTIATLMAGVLVIIVIAWAADRWGLLGGWSTLILAQLASQIEPWLEGLYRDKPWGTVSAGAIAVALLATAAGALATLAVLRGPPLRRAQGERDDPFVRAPPAGWVPITGAFSVLAGVAILFALGVDPPRWLVELLHGAAAPSPGVSDPIQAFYGTPPRFAITLGLVVLLGAGFAFLYSRPGVWREGRRRLRGGAPADPAAERRAFVHAALLGGAWAAALVTLYYLFYRTAPEALVPLTVAMVTPALLVNAVAEWRARSRRADLVTVWPLHQVQLADEAAAALAAEGIAVHLRGLRYRSLLHFFGPEVPIAIMVPVADAERAHTLLAERLTPR